MRTPCTLFKYGKEQLVCVKDNYYFMSNTIKMHFSFRWLINKNVVTHEWYLTLSTLLLFIHHSLSETNKKPLAVNYRFLIVCIYFVRDCIQCFCCWYYFVCRKLFFTISLSLFLPFKVIWVTLVICDTDKLYLA